MPVEKIEPGDLSIELLLDVLDSAYPLPQNYARVMGQKTGFNSHHLKNDIAVVQRIVVPLICLHEQDVSPGSPTQKVLMLAGNGASGTVAAVDYFLEYYEQLYQVFGEKDFAVVLRSVRPEKRPSTSDVRTRGSEFVRRIMIRRDDLEYDVLGGFVREDDEVARVNVPGQ